MTHMGGAYFTILASVRTDEAVDRACAQVYKCCPRTFINRHPWRRQGYMRVQAGWQCTYGWTKHRSGPQGDRKENANDRK